MKLVLIPAGEFLMGSPDSYRHGNFDPKDEKPQQRVRISKPFLLGVHEVTVGQFRQFVNAVGYRTDAEKDGQGALGFNPSTRKWERKAECNWRNPGFEQSDDHPAVNVSWNDAEAFCIWLSKTEPDHPRYRLPSEAEWEYACRAGTTTQYWPGDDPETLAQVDNVADAAAKAKVFELLKETISNSDGHVFTAPVGRFRANGFGLYDVHGNVSEWCADWYYGDLSGAPSGNPPTSPAMSLRVTRGGCWLADPFNARSARRSRAAPRVRETYIGFRVARNP